MTRQGAEMRQQLDLLTYPAQPGYKAPGPSREAAEAIRPTAATLRELCLRMLRRYGDLTADEAAAFCNQSVLGIRPRFSELKEMGLIEKTGERRKNASGMSATVWRVKA